MIGLTAPILGKYPRDCIHTSCSFVSLTVRGTIKHGFPSGLLKAWRVGSVWKEGGGHLREEESLIPGERCSSGNPCYINAHEDQ